MELETQKQLEQWKAEQGLRSGANTFGKQYDAAVKNLVEKHKYENDYVPSFEEIRAEIEQREEMERQISGNAAARQAMPDVAMTAGGLGVLPPPGGPAIQPTTPGVDPMPVPAQPSEEQPPQWYLDLPSGAEYTAPDGTRRIKPFQAAKSQDPNQVPQSNVEIIGPNSLGRYGKKFPDGHVELLPEGSAEQIPQWVLNLEPGTVFTAPDGTQRVR